jgi:hypothetical protein
VAQVCTVLMASASALPLGGKQLVVRPDYATSAAVVSANTKQKAGVIARNGGAGRSYFLSRSRYCSTIVAIRS